MSRVSPPPPPTPPGSTAGAKTWLPGGHGTSDVCVCLVTQSCPTLCHPLDCSPPGSSVHGILRQEHWSGLPCAPPLGTWICFQPGYAGGESMALSWAWGRARAQLFPPTVSSQTMRWLWAGHTPFLLGWQLGRVLAPKMPILCHAVPVHATLPWVP